MSQRSELPPTLSPPLDAEAADERAVLDDTRRWLERAVIGLNLCPFAKAVHAKGQIHYAVSRARTTEALLVALAGELDQLMACESAERNTTLLIVPDGFSDFLDFNDFLSDADELLTDMRLDGTLQIASFHPDFQFADTRPDDMTNATNRAPYPTLHLLREDSVELAVAAFPEAEMIFERNIETLKRLGAEGWAALGVGASANTSANITAPATPEADT